MAKPKVTVAVITKNEEKNIARCLKSVGWADELIVVDGHSTDKTAEIARGMGAKVVLHAFTGRFADDRNIAMEHARNDWVLHIDADDVASESFKDKMDASLGHDLGYTVYKFRRRNFFLGHSMDFGGFHHYIPNLVDRRKVRYEGNVHEVPVYSGKEGVVEADIDHYPFDSIGSFVDRQNRYAGIAAADILKKHGLLSSKEIRRGLLGKTWKVFWKSYVKKQGYRDGFYGLIFACLFAFITFLKWAKYWELVKDKLGEVASSR